MQSVSSGETIKGSKAAGLDLEALQAKLENNLDKITTQLTEEMTMKRFIRKRPRPATIIAIVALIVAMAGTAIAAGPFLPKRKFVNFKGNALKGLTYVTNSQSVPIGGGATVHPRRIDQSLKRNGAKLFEPVLGECCGRGEVS